MRRDFQGLGYWVDDGGYPTHLLSVDAESRPGQTWDLADTVPRSGPRCWRTTAASCSLSFEREDARRMLVSSWDENLQSLGYIEVPPFTPDGWEPYWSQGAMRVGNIYVVTHMASDSSQVWTTLEGDVFLAAFDLDWNVIDTLQLSHNVAPNGGHAAGLALKDDHLLVLYAVDPLQLRVRSAHRSGGR